MNVLDLPAHLKSPPLYTNCLALQRNGGGLHAPASAVQSGVYGSAYLQARHEAPGGRVYIAQRLRIPQEGPAWWHYGFQ
jgi:hypothetical protein